MLLFFLLPIVLFASDNEKIDVICTNPILSTEEVCSLFVSSESINVQSSDDSTLKDGHTFFISINMDDYQKK